MTPLKFKVDRLQIILVAKKYISTCRKCSSVACLKCVQLPRCVQKEVTSSGETPTLSFRLANTPIFNIQLTLTVILKQHSFKKKR